MRDERTELIRQLKEFRSRMTRQEIKTIRGQILCGDLDGAVSGIERIAKRGIRAGPKEGARAKIKRKEG